MISSNQNSGTRRRRAWLARAILIVATISLVTGILVDHYQSRAPDPWRTRLVRGEPVELQFLCGPAALVDCKTTAKMTYQKRDSEWCASLQTGAQEDVSRERSCNGDPEHGTISILGVVHSFDRYGMLKVNDRLVGRMLSH